MCQRPHSQCTPPAVAGVRPYRCTVSCTIKMYLIRMCWLHGAGRGGYSGEGAPESPGIFHMMDEAKTAGTESAPPAGAGGAAAAADAAERPPIIPADELARLTDEIVGALKTVYDPEIPADLYELGLIYKVDIDDDRMVTIDMTLTTPNCPSAAELPGQVENAVAGVSGVREAKVHIVWDPPWDPSRMSDEARTVLDMW